MRQEDDFKKLFKGLDDMQEPPVGLRTRVYEKIIQSERKLYTLRFLEKIMKISIPASIAMNFILDLKVI